MARIDYADPASPDLSDLVERIVAERGELLHLYRMLLHSPPVAEGWLDLMTAIRQKSALPGAVREQVIIRIAYLNGAAYEAEQHGEIALREGVSSEQLEALADWNGQSHLFGPAERAALGLCDQMTRNVRVDRQCWDQVRAQWPDRQVVELVAAIAAYNMVSRVLVALEIGSADVPGAVSPPQ